MSLVHPDIVKAEVVDGIPGESADPLDPCPNCGSYRHESPEGVHDHVSARKHHTEPGTPRWIYEHCWKCGHRPGVNAVIRADVMTKAFEQFKQMYAHAFAEFHQAPGIAAPSSNEEVEALKAQLAAAQSKVAELEGQ